MGTEPTEQDSPQFALVPVEMTHLGYHLVGGGGYWMMLCCGLKSAGVLVWELLGRGFDASQGQTLPVISLGLAGRNSKVIHSCSLPMLDLEAHGKRRTVSARPG